ncbi:MAG: leucine-rich repeat protein [Muribaculum sp.]
MNTKKLLIALALVIGIATTACNDDDGAYITGTTKETNDCLRNGISVGPNMSLLTLEFNHSQGELKVSSDAGGWKESTTEPALGEISTTVNIKILPNDDWGERKCTLSLSLLDKYVEIPVTQNEGFKVEPQSRLYNVGREGGDFTVKVRANTDELTPKIEFVESRDEWLRYDGYEKTGDNEYTLRFHADPNTAGLGRMCGILYTRTTPGDSRKFCIWQEPRIFNADEYIDLHFGCLYIYLGTDRENIRRIRHLTLKGSINDIDWSALKQLCIFDSGGNKAPQDRMITLDLSNVITFDGETSPYSQIGFVHDKVTCKSGGDDQIPESVFQYVTNLADIKMPLGTAIIQPYAFSSCTGLNHIEIPKSVTIICQGAFKFSENLSEIIIGNYSMLRRVGQMAFMNCGPIKMLNLPATLTDLDFGSLQCSVIDMKVGWLTPPDLNPYPRVYENSTLFVPPGTVEAYRAHKGWSRFPKIVERDDMDKDGNILTPEW